MMKTISYPLLIISFLLCHSAFSQETHIDKVKFFEDTSIINATITTDMVKLFRQKEKAGVEFPANFSATLPGNIEINDPILLTVRGHYRRGYCYLPPLKVAFKYNKASAMKPLGDLKLVSQCKISEMNEQYLFKEFLSYKIYNLITDKSFRVRLLNLQLVDSGGKKKPISEHAFLMEDIKNLAKRNGCKDWKTGRMDPREVDRRQMTIVAIFEYMIGNTDWAVSVNHNTKLILSKNDSLQRPYVVPYDFDFSGFVNTDYSVPDEKLNISSVTERLYRGFPRSLDEINEVLEIYKKQKSNIYSLINNFDLLTSKSKKEIINYLDDFYSTINKPKEVKNIFVDNARTN
ncbi:MAG: hypothetical protein ABI261_05110 [Ginsengibacter sp.]